MKKVRKVPWDEIRKEFETTNKSVKDLSLEFDISVHNIYTKIREQNWDGSNNKGYKSKSRPIGTMKLKGERLKRFLSLKQNSYDDRRACAVVIISLRLLKRYCNTALNSLEILEKNGLHYEDINLKKTKLLDEYEKACLNFYVKYTKASIEGEQRWLDLIKKAAEGYEIEEKEYKHSVDKDGKAALEHQIKKVKQVKSDPKCAMWILERHQEWKERYIKPQELTLQGNEDKPITYEERKKDIDEILSRFDISDELKAQEESND